MASATIKIKISAAVGRNCPNQPADVRIVQRLINDSLPDPLRPIDVDGTCTPPTISAIEDIQRRSLHMKIPDGKVNKVGPTLTFLAANASPETIAALPTGDDYDAAVRLTRNLRVKAMLTVLAFTEGTGTDYGKVVDGVVLTSPYFPELVGKKNVSVTDLTRHPDILVQVNSNIKSTAAGRYQFIKGTWDSLKMVDFSASSQDIAAVRLMQQANMIEPLLADDLEEAVQQGAPVWASLPTATGASFYGGQTARSMAQIRQVYRQVIFSGPTFSFQQG
jgi:muramidase (phage lysozyme)